MCLECVEKEPPFFDVPALKALLLIVSEGVPDFKDPDSMSDEIKDFIQVCTKMNPEDRPTAEELLKHPFLRCSGNVEELTPLVKLAKEESEKMLAEEAEFGAWN